jgi:F0F1-type ATP synthase delta subunit
MQSDEFVKPLTDLLQDFKQAQALHNHIYSVVVRERNPLEHKERTKLRRRNAEPLGDLATLEALKKELEGGE